MTNLEINTIINENSVIVEWSAVAEANGVIASYKVNVSKYNGPQVSAQIINNPQTLQTVVLKLGKGTDIYYLFV